MATMKFRGMRHMTIAAVVAAGLALGACGGGGGTSGGAAPTVGGEVSGDLNILVSSATGSDAGFKAVTKAFNTKYPNVKVELLGGAQRELQPDPLIPADRRQRGRRRRLPA